MESKQERLAIEEIYFLLSATLEYIKNIIIFYFSSRQIFNQFFCFLPSEENKYFRFTKIFKTKIGMTSEAAYSEGEVAALL